MKVNRILIGLVIVLLFVAIIAFANVLLNQYAGHVMEWGSISDWVSTGCNTIMAGAALYAAMHAKGWIIEKNFDHVKDFMKIMTKVNDELYAFVCSSTGGDMELDLAMELFRPADEQMKIIFLGVSKEKQASINKKYNQFKNETIYSWIEGRDYSNDPDHEHTKYFDFYEYLNTEVLK